MPNLTVSGNVDTMLGAADNAAIRSAIGLGQTDAPTFLAQTLTGQSLTGTQATSLVDLATTWNTSGTPTAIKLNVVETGINSNAASKLMDLQVGGASKFIIGKDGSPTPNTQFVGYRLNGYASFALAQVGGVTGISNPASGVVVYSDAAFSAGNGQVRLYSSGVTVGTGGSYAFTSAGGADSGAVELLLSKDAPGILAQRNARVPQAFRVYNDYVDVNNYERAVFDYKSSLGDLIIGHEALGSGMVANRTIKFKTAGFFPLQLDTSNATFGVNILTSGFCTWLVPVSAPTNTSNRSIVWELASNTALTIKVRGTDGVVRSVALTLA